MSQQPEKGEIDSDGFAIHYQRWRRPNTPTTLLVHGWGADIGSNWLAPGWVSKLTPFADVIAMDVRGHGRSDKPIGEGLYDYGSLCRDVLSLLDALQLSRVNYVGYSMGAFMGAWLLGHHADRLNSMVLGGIGDETAETAAQGAQIAAALRAEGPVSGYANAVRAFVAANSLNDPLALACSAEQMWPDGYPRKLLGDRAANAALPVLVLNGAEDRPYVDSADAFVAALPNARHQIVPGVDHLQAVSDPAYQAAAIRFLRQHWGTQT